MDNQEREKLQAFEDFKGQMRQRMEGARAKKERNEAGFTYHFSEMKNVDELIPEDQEWWKRIMEEGRPRNQAEYETLVRDFGKRRDTIYTSAFAKQTPSRALFWQVLADEIPKISLSLDDEDQDL